LSLADKGEIVAALFDGFNRQNQALGYPRAFGAMMRALLRGIDTLVADIPFDLAIEIKKSKFWGIAQESEEEFAKSMTQKLENFVCPSTGLKF
jgi:hypothetical protein